jgi:hypothetical protein
MTDQTQTKKAEKQVENLEQQEAEELTPEQAEQAGGGFFATDPSVRAAAAGEPAHLE